MKKYKLAAALMIIHGGCMEIGGMLSFIPVLLMGSNQFDLGQYFSFKLPYFQDNLYMMIFMGGIYGILRVIGAVGLLKNRMWGFILSVINCVVTLILMMFMLPMGVVDGIFAGAALVLILIQYYDKREI